MTHLELGDGWIIEKYSSVGSEWYTIIHIACESRATTSRHGIRAVIKGKICISCHKQVPDEVLGMLRLCKWRP